MARPPKTATVLKLEKKSHRTKKELVYRDRSESGTVSGINIKERPEVKHKPEAHRTFLKVKKLLKSIGKDDAIYEAEINRYCMITSEVVEAEADRLRLEQIVTEIEDHREEYEHPEYMRQKLEVTKQKLAIDRELRAKRQQLFAIEKENCMTIAAALRIIPKNPETKTSALKDALGYK